MIYLVISQEGYDHSYSEHSIRCISRDLDVATKRYDRACGKCTEPCYGPDSVMLLEWDENVAWEDNDVFALFAYRYH